MYFSTLLSVATLFHTSIAGYVLQDDYMKDFYSNFNFFTEDDPTEGFVKFVDEPTAKQSGLINTTYGGGVQWGVDTKNKTPSGRPSIRIESKKSYDSGLIVLDVAHMPFGCGTWPAFWTIGPNWPKNGEIDILEGVNEQTNNGMVLHTGPGCEISQDQGQFAGTVTTPNCDINAEGQGDNVGCSIKHPSTASYGAGLNKAGGGVYATEWTDEAISIWFFPRGSIPNDTLSDSPNPSTWGMPSAKFSGGCDIEKNFAQQTIIFDTTFCGQWAGSVWSQGSCAKKAATCNEYVRDNPQAFTEAYWSIKALKVYQSSGQATPSQGSSTQLIASATIKPSSNVASSRPAATATSKPASSMTTTGKAPVAAPSGRSGFQYPTKIPGASQSIASQSKLSSTAPASSTIALKTSVNAPISPVSPNPATSSTIAVPSVSTPPTSTQSAPQVDQKPVSQSPTISPRQTRTATTQPAASTGVNGMPGFQWPLLAGDDTSQVASSTTKPAALSTSAVVTPGSASNTPVFLTTVQNLVQSPVPGTGVVQISQPASGSTGAAVPYVPAVTSMAGGRKTRTVFETVYVTAAE